MEVIGPLVGANIDLAFGSIAATPAGPDNIGNTVAHKYDMDTGSASATAQTGLQIAGSMLGGKVKFDSLKGSAWIENRDAKFPSIEPVFLKYARCGSMIEESKGILHDAQHGKTTP